MTPEQFRDICVETSTSVSDLTRILKASPRSVARWYGGGRPVPVGVALLMRTLRHVQGFTDLSSTADFLRSELRLIESLPIGYKDSGGDEAHNQRI